MSQAEVPLVGLEVPGKVRGGKGLARADVILIPRSSGAAVKTLGTEWVQYMAMLGLAIHFFP